MTAEPGAPHFAVTGWPWRPGNEFRLLDGGAEFFPRMLTAIETARSHVLLEMYLASSGRVAGAFIEALRRARLLRGVRCCVLFDGFGALGLERLDRRQLEDAGVELRFFNPLHWRNRLRNFKRDHRKLLAVDGEVAFVGGAGLADEFAGPDAWRELMVEIRGPVVADWQRAFAGSWRRYGPELGLPERLIAPLTGGAVGRLSLSEARQHSVLADGVIRRIDAAGTRAWLMSAYFVPSRRFRRALRRAARRGVDVRLMMPSARTDHPWVRQAARRFYGRMLRAGVQIFEYQPRVLHAKMILCDDWLSIGSSNLDRWSFKWNLEANQEVADARVADTAAALFAGDLAASHPLSGRHWPQRAWLDRLRERIAGALDRWLEGWRRPP